MKNIFGKPIKHNIPHVFHTPNQYPEWLGQNNSVGQHKNENPLPRSMLECKYIPNLSYIGRKYLERYDIHNGTMLQIGATTRNPDTGQFIKQPKTHPVYNHCTFYNLDLIEDTSENTIVGDITNCPQIPDNTYDFVYSEDTFEHIKEPWLAAKEIIRILKPGGLTYHYTVFSWRYHEVPIDYWRFTPPCLAFLFKDIECLEANWDIKNRRVPIQGDNSANDLCPEDHMGPWMENWRVYYVGRKKE